jgi:hypothetical protein
MGQDWVGPSRHRPIAHGWRPRTPRKTKQAQAGSMREARGAKEVPEALSKRQVSMLVVFRVESS